MSVALKFAYDGTKFHGYARQPNVRTVEGEVLKALDSIGARHLRFRSASRTDKGVSALGNVIAFDTNFRPEELCGALNSRLEDIFFYAYARVPLEFWPRYADERWYRYHLYGRHDVKLLNDISELFMGEHDFSSFSKIEKGRNPVRSIDSIEIREDGDFTLIDIRAQSFLWQMVRRIVGAMISVEMGEKSIEDVERALHGEKVIFRIAEPEPLFLMDVVHRGVHFKRNELDGLEEYIKKTLLRLKFLKYLG
jgi:tRNA pseudouridine38-40 synthase